MPNIPPLEVITKDIPKNTTGFDKVIKERKLLKTKVKLIHIALFDKDLRNINNEGFDIEGLCLEDFKLTSESNLVVPIYNKIVLSKEKNSLLDSYLIYLSYLYNIDLVSLYKSDYHMFYKIIINIELPVEIKINLFELIKYHTGEYFSNNVESLNSAEYREKIHQDEKKIRSLCVK